MKYTWELSDIKPGIFVCKDPSYQGHKEFIPCGNSAKWTIMIGFNFLHNPDEYNPIYIIDGMVTKAKTKQEFCDWFNREELIPMPVEWLEQVIREYKK